MSWYPPDGQRGSTQIRSTREGFGMLLGIFGGWFWKSFPCKKTMKKQKHVEKNKTNLRKAHKNLIFIIFCSFLCVDPRTDDAKIERKNTSPNIGSKNCMQNVCRQPYSKKKVKRHTMLPYVPPVSRNRGDEKSSTQKPKKNFGKCYNNLYKKTKKI